MKQKIKLNKQYGLISNEIIKNKNISANAKALYTYLSARSGNKFKCNPTISTICKDLNICKDTLYKYLKELQENKIIEIEKGQMCSNTYHLQKVTKGYGIVLLDIAKDPTVPLKAKALYGLMASLIGGNKFTYIFSNQIKNILNLGRTTYFKLKRILVDKHYLKTKQKLNKGKFSCNLFYFDKLPTLEENNTIQFKTITKSDLHNHADITETNTLKTNLIKERIEYEALLFKYSDNPKALNLLENILEIIAGITSSKYPKNITVNGIEIQGYMLKVIYNKITYTTVDNVITNVLSVENKIKNLRNYLKAALYNNYYYNNYN